MSLTLTIFLSYMPHANLYPLVRITLVNLAFMSDRSEIFSQSVVPDTSRIFDIDKFHWMIKVGKKR